MVFNSVAVSSLGTAFSLISSTHFSAPIISCSIFRISSLKLAVCSSSSICSCWYLLDSMTKLRSVIFPLALYSYIFKNRRSISVRFRLSVSFSRPYPRPAVRLSPRIEVVPTPSDTARHSGYSA